MDEQLYRGVLAALEVSHAPTTTPNGRAIAYSELEKFKERNDCDDYAMYILENFEHDNYARHFALQCLSYKATTIGNDPGPLGESLRLKAATLLTNGTKPLNIEAPHIKEAIASLVSDIAERSFPQLWPNFIDGVLQAWNNSNDGTSAEICMFVLRNIAEDCTDANFNSRLTTGRRNDILRAIKPHVQTLLNLTYSYMSIQYQILIENDNTNNTNNEVVVNTATILLRGCLNMLKRFVLWIKPDELLNDHHDFLSVCLTIMTLPSCREEASSMLAVIVTRKLDMLSVKKLLEQLPIMVSSTPAPAHETDALVFWRSIGGIITDLITVNAQNIAEDETLLASPLFCQYIDLALSLVGHPSLKLASNLHLLFFGIYRMKKARLVMEPNAVGSTIGMLSSRVHSLIALYSPKLIRPIGLDEGVLSPIFDEEFGDEEELIGFFGQFRGQVAAMIRILVDVFPAETIVATRDAFDVLLRKHSILCGDYLDARGRTTQRSSSVLELEGFGTILENVLGSISVTKLQSDVASSSYAIDILRLLATWRSKDPLLRATQFNLLTSLRNVMIVAANASIEGDELLLLVLDLCFCGLESGESWEVEPVPKETVAGDAVTMLRRRAGACLIAIGKAMPQVLVRHLEKLASRVSEMITRGGLREMQRMHCLEMLVAISNAVEDPNERIALVAQIAGDSVREWTSEEYTTMVSSPMALLTNCLGIDVAPYTINADQSIVSSIIHRVHGISNSLNTLQSISRRVLPSSSLQKSSSSPSLSSLNNTNHQSQYLPLSSSPPSLSKMHGSSSNLSSHTQDHVHSLQGIGGTKKVTISPFAPLWPTVLPNVIALIRSLHGIWSPSCTQHLLNSQTQSPQASSQSPPSIGLGYILSMSDQEITYKTNLSGITQPKMPGVDGASGAVYEQGGETLLGSSLEEMRKRWLNELRTVAYVMLGTAASHGSLYELQGAADAVISAFLSDIEYMEHRHLSLLLKHAIEPFVLNCPSHQLSIILPPLLAPLIQHCLKRLSTSWQYIDIDEAKFTSASTIGNNVIDKDTPAAFRRDGGLILESDIEEATREMIVDKTRQELTRTYLGILMSWLALTGDLAKAFINYDGAGTGGTAELEPAHSHGALGLNRSLVEVEDDAMKRLNANELSKFLFLGNKDVSFPLVATITAALVWPDGGCCRRTLALCHKFVDLVGNEPIYEIIIGKHLFHSTLYILSKSPLWLGGLEWDMLNLSRDIYCLLGIGISADKLIFAVASTRGIQNQQSKSNHNDNMNSNNINIDNTHNNNNNGDDVSSNYKGLQDIPSKFFNIVQSYPREVLLESGGVSIEDMYELDTCLGQATDSKAQKDAMREILRLRHENSATTGAHGGSGGHPSSSSLSSSSVGNAIIRDGVAGNNDFVATSSIKCRPPAILDLPRYFNQNTSNVAVAGGGGVVNTEEALSGLSFLFGEN
mmetsp:Transcript_20758/g.26993  ORF Transcript_20758/g.26993 Transcript_20758/m.26993 type:complete len:1442 (+) Transcript_20758:118-4443(+)